MAEYYGRAEWGNCLMLVPVVLKSRKSNDVFIERLLPDSGHLTAKVGDKVEPFTRLGMAKVSYKVMNLHGELKLDKRRMEGGFFYTGDYIGTLDGKRIIAPFDGYLKKKDDVFLLKEEERDYWLLAGVWGDVVDVVTNKSVLIKTQVLDFTFCVCSPESIAGELIVFPNPSEILEMQYLEKFAKDVAGKVIYVGNFASNEVINKAIELGVGAVLAGSVDRQGFTLAKKGKMFLGIFEGFGHIPTPDLIFNVLKEVSNRYVFVQGERNLIRIPMPERYDDNLIADDKIVHVVKNLEVGDSVEILEHPFFGWVGKVTNIASDQIVEVKVMDSEEVVKVKYPNLVAVK